MILITTYSGICSLHQFTGLKVEMLAYSPKKSAGEKY
jgi:hypothetical protein